LRCRWPRASKRVALGFLFNAFFEHLLAALCEGRHRVVAEALSGAPEVALVRARFDLAHDALPILLVRVVALDRGFELEPQAGVSYLFAPKGPQPPIDVLAHRQGLEALDAHEVLLVKGA
jgi:hypothetical protein